MRTRRVDGLEEFVVARTQDLHQDAYALTGSSRDSEDLVARVLAELAREHVDFTQAGSVARLRMARAVARTDCTPHEPGNVPIRFESLVGLTSCQRAILLLKAVDGHDLHSAGRVLGLTARDTEQAHSALPPELADTDPAGLRSLLQDFGDLAEVPHPAKTLAAIRAVPPPPHRPRWSYAVAALVIAVTISTVWVTQGWHDDWMHTAAGLNHTHGTHFPAYADGYKLVDIKEVAAVRRDNLALGASSALAFPCSDGQPNGSTVGQVVTGNDGNYAAHCSAAGLADLMPTSGDTLLTIADTGRTKLPVGVYRKIP